MRIESIRKIHWDMVAMFVVLLCCDTAAQLFFKQATLNVGEIPLDSIKHLTEYLIQLSQNMNVWLGVADQEDVSQVLRQPARPVKGPPVGSRVVLRVA